MMLRFQARPRNRIDASLAEQLQSSGGHTFSLVSRALELELTGLSTTVSAGDSRCTVRRPADDLCQCHLARMAIGQAHHHKTKVQQIRDDGEQRRLVAAVLRR